MEEGDAGGGGDRSSFVIGLIENRAKEVYFPFLPVTSLLHLFDCLDNAFRPLEVKKKKKFS